MKGFMRRGLACLLAVLLLCAGGTALAAPDMDVMRDGMVIVAVTGRVPSGEQASDWSTGFIVGPSNGPARYILTSRFMFDQYRSVSEITVYANNLYETITLRDEGGNSLEFPGLPIIEYDLAGSYVMIQVEELFARNNLPPKKSLPMKRMKTINMGDTLYMLGMKPNSDNRLEAVRYPCVAEERGQNGKGDTVLRVSTNEFYGELYGGPIVTEDGFVVGITDYFTQKQANETSLTYTAFLDIATVMDYFESEEMVYYSDTDPGILPEDGLSSFDIPRGTQKVENDDSDFERIQGSDLPITSGESEDPAILDDLAVPVDPGNPNTPANPANPESKGQSNAALYVILAVVVLAAAGGGFYMMSKKKQSAPNESYHTEAQVAAVNVPSAHKEEPKAKATGIWLHCVAGPLEGQKFNLEPATVIGRDPKRAKILFADDTKGISGAHCELKISGNAIQLTDLGSSYGTYLSDGTKLTAKQPYTVKKGDSFYLGSKQVGFTIE